MTFSMFAATSRNCSSYQECSGDAINRSTIATTCPSGQRVVQNRFWLPGQQARFNRYYRYVGIGHDSQPPLREAESRGIELFAHAVQSILREAHTSKASAVITGKVVFRCATRSEDQDSGPRCQRPAEGQFPPFLERDHKFSRRGHGYRAYDAPSVSPSTGKIGFDIRRNRGQPPMTAPLDRYQRAEPRLPRLERDRSHAMSERMRNIDLCVGATLTARNLLVYGLAHFQRLASASYLNDPLSIFLLAIEASATALKGTTHEH